MDTKYTKAMKAAVEGIKALGGEFTYDYRNQVASNANGSVVVSKSVFDKLTAAGEFVAAERMGYWTAK